MRPGIEARHQRHVVILIVTLITKNNNAAPPTCTISFLLIKGVTEEFCFRDLPMLQLGLVLAGAS